MQGKIEAKHTSSYRAAADKTAQRPRGVVTTHASYSASQRDQVSNYGLVESSPKVAQLRAVQMMANEAVRTKHQPTIQKKANNTGLPDNLRAGIENLSGISMDDVQVHRNSSKPAQLQAHAYAQGNQIHLGPGQEKHLPHEAWHVVQQKQGRVKPTLQMKRISVNDDKSLEREADVMGERAVNRAPIDISTELVSQRKTSGLIQRNVSSTNEAVVQREHTNPPSGQHSVPPPQSESVSSRLFKYIDDKGSKQNRVKEEGQRRLLMQEADRGDQLIAQIMQSYDPVRRQGLIGHAQDIRAVCWALYRRAHAKHQGHIGGMMVLEDNGALASFLSSGKEVKKQKDSREQLATPDAQGVPYYSRASSHFQERRDSSLGLDFHGFAVSDDKGGKSTDTSLKLPLQKSTLHFGTLDGGKRTFIKFEYYGFMTTSDKLLHSKEWVKTRFKQEIGHREDHISDAFVRDIKKLLIHYGVPESMSEKIEHEGKTYTAKKSGLYFARIAISKIRDEERRRTALANLPRILERHQRLMDHADLRQHDEIIFTAAELSPVGPPVG